MINKLSSHLGFMRSIIMNYPNERTAALEWMRYIDRNDDDSDGEFDSLYRYLKLAYTGYATYGIKNLEQNIFMLNPSYQYRGTISQDYNNKKITVVEFSDIMTEYIFVQGKLPKFNFNNKIVYQKWEDVKVWAIIKATRAIVYSRIHDSDWLNLCQTLPVD